MFPQGLGNVTYDYDEEMEYGSFRGINIDVEWASKITEISIVIQTPKDTLKSVSIGEGMSDYINIIQGFTSLYELQIPIHVNIKKDAQRAIHYILEKK